MIVHNSSFGPAVWPIIGNTYTNILFYYMIYIFRKEKIYPENFLCAGYEGGGKDSCQVCTNSSSSHSSHHYTFLFSFSSSFIFPHSSFTNMTPFFSPFMATIVQFLSYFFLLFLFFSSFSFTTFSFSFPFIFLLSHSPLLSFSTFLYHILHFFSFLPFLYYIP